MACRLYGVKPLPEPKLAYCWLDPLELISLNFEAKYNSLHMKSESENVIFKSGNHLISGMCIDQWCYFFGDKK